MDGAHAEGIVAAVSSDDKHRFSKPNRTSINLIEGLGVEGDAHAGAFVKHRWLARRNAALPNLRQVHLMHAELFDKLCAIGFEVKPGALGENITTRGLELLALPLGSRLHIGESAVVEVTGIREPLRLYRQIPEGPVEGDDRQGAGQGHLIQKRHLGCGPWRRRDPSR